MNHNWEYKPIEDCFAYIKNGATIKQEKGAVGFPITRIETLSNGVFNRSKMGYANILELGKYALNVLNDGDLLMSHINSKTYVGRTVLYEALPNEIIIHGMNLLRLIPNETTLSKFFYYITLSHYFKSKIVNIRKDAVNQSSFSITDLKKIPIPVPQMEVQQQIVEELDKINEVIEDCRELLRNLDALAKSLFYDYFGDPVTNPKGWKVNKVSDNFETGSGGTPSKSISEFWNSDDIPWIGSNMCQNEILHNTDGKFISNLGLENSSAKLLYPDTLLVALVGATIGKVALLKIPTSTNQNIGFIKPNKDIANPIFLFYTLQGLYPLFLGIGNGKFKMANLSFIRDLPIILPPLELQEKFAERIEQINAQKKAVEETIANMQVLLDSRMDYWFN